MYAFGESYAVLITARCMQGIGSAATTTAGMALLADCYTTDKERGEAMGTAMGGLALGVLSGPPYGGVSYHNGGKEVRVEAQAQVRM